WKPVLGFAIFLVLLTAGIQIYRSVETSTAATQTAEMMPLISAPATIENAKALEDFADNRASGKRKPLALLYAAGKYQTANKPDDAVRVLAKIVDSSAPEALKNYARVLQANAEGKTDAVRKVDKESAWYPAVQELEALSEADTQKRREIYAKIANDKAAPTALRKRAAEFSGETIGP
ncbi:MAG TPA: hypothetical protein PKW15_03445, partial [Alphaproteobacteria bacterium]|nr:hypothetical protein [Alphaproteobacteria bacterium]